MTLRRDVLVGVDAGTTLIKAAAFDRAGDLVAVASVPNPVLRPEPNAAEQDMDAVRDRACLALRRLGEATPGLAERTLAVGLTGQGDGLWPVDRHGEPAGPATIWLDGRSSTIVDRLRASGVADAVFARTGTALSTSMPSAQLLRLREAGPLPARMHKILHCKDWLHTALTGVIATDRAEGPNAFGSLATGDYEADVLDLLGLSDARALLPEIIDGVAHNHPLTADAASRSGLLAGTPIVLAPPDYVATALGMGLVDPAEDTGCTIVGSAGVHMMLFDDPAGILHRTPCGHAVAMPIPGVYLRMISHMTGSLSIDWLVDTLRQAGRDLFSAERSFAEIIGPLETAAAGCEPGRLIFHPFMASAGERAPFIAPSARAQFIGLSQTTTLPDLLRAIYEGLGFAARDCYGQMQRYPAGVHVFGGASRSALLPAILASAVGVPHTILSEVEAGARGAALVAGVSAGLFANLAAEAKSWRSGLRGVACPPDPALAARYRRLFPIYRRTYEQMFEAWDQLATESRPA